MFKRIDHIELLTAEPERTIAFYVGALGFRERERARIPETPRGPLDLVYLQLGDTTVEVMCYPEALSIPFRAPELRLGWQCLALEVDDMGVALDALKAKGVDAVWGPLKRPDYARAEVRDPDGNPIEIRQWMTVTQAPYHAHIYYDVQDREPAERLHRRFSEAVGGGDAVNVVFVGEMRDANVGPHPGPQFEIHFFADALPSVVRLIEGSGLTALVHPLTDDDLADHTSLGTWIGEPLALDLSVLDPPGANQGKARFGKSDF